MSQGPWGGQSMGLTPECGRGHRELPGEWGDCDKRERSHLCKMGQQCVLSTNVGPVSQVFKFFKRKQIPKYLCEHFQVLMVTSYSQNQTKPVRINVEPSKQGRPVAFLPWPVDTVLHRPDFWVPFISQDLQSPGNSYNFSFSGYKDFFSFSSWGSWHFDTAIWWL